MEPGLVSIARLTGAVFLFATVLGCEDHYRGEGGAWHTASAAPARTAETVDLLFMIDDSPSMLEEQLALSLGVAVGELRAEIEAARATIAVTSTDRHGPAVETAPGNVQSAGCIAPLPDAEACPPVGPIVSAESDDWVGAVQCLLAQGDCGNSFEFGLAALGRAVSDPRFTSTADALGIVILSDEDDCSTETMNLALDSDCYAAENRSLLVPVETVVEAVLASRPDARDAVSVLSIIGPDDGVPPQPRSVLNLSGPLNACAPGTTSGGVAVHARDGERYREFGRHFQPRYVEESICEADLPGALLDFLRTIRMPREGLERFVCLDPAPVGLCATDADCEGACVLPGARPGLCDDAPAVEVRLGPDRTDEYAIRPPNRADGPVLLDLEAWECATGVAVRVDDGRDPIRVFAATWLAAE